jgi:hypothetical protein
MTLQDVFGSLPLPSGRVLRWLLGQGVPFDSLYGVKAAWVTFDGAGFDFDPVMTGSPVLIFRCADNGHTPDICAWSIRHNKLATWRGAGFCIGDVDQCFNPATWFAGGGLRVHRTPLDWLKAGCDGIMILRPELCHAYLRHVPRVICADVGHGDSVNRWTQPPKLKTKFFIEMDIEQGIDDGQRIRTAAA